jgi:uncharacterized repeat protein (TIGR03847 family)
MPEPEPFGTLIYIGAEAIGQPGARRFRIKAMNEDGRSAALWLEKEQLVALADAIETVLKDEGLERGPFAPDDMQYEPVFPLNCSIDFRLGQLSMGIDRSRRMIVLVGAEAVAEGQESTGTQLEFDYTRGAQFRQQILGVVAAGRPPCPLCGGPLDPQGHVCPRSNGHHKQE